MIDLKTFASFLRKNKLHELVCTELDYFRAFDLPLLKQFAKLPESDIFERSRQGMQEFLVSIETGTAIERAKQNLIKLQNDTIPGISKSAVSLSDLVLIYSSQKMALLQHLALFTQDTSEAVRIMMEIENYYREVQELSTNLLLKIHADEQEKLVESEERYRDLFDNASDLIHIVSPEGIILYVNQEWRNSLGYQQHELEGQSIYVFIVESERDKYFIARESVVRGNVQQQHIETSLKSKDGKEVIVEGSLTCKFKDGKPQHTRGILRNVTEKKAAAKKLQFFNEQLMEREENIQQLIQNAPDAVIVIDEWSQIILWNPKAEDIFGWKAEEVTGSILTEIIIPHQYRHMHTEGMKRLISTGQSHILNKTVEITALNKSGNEFYVSLTISSSSQQGDIVFIAFIRDISEQKKNQLELDQKRIQLERSNKELEQYAWLTSHDLKEPLRKILTFSDILLINYSSRLGEDGKIHLEKINKVALRMDALIEDLLHYSNVSEDSTLFVPTDLNTIVHEVLTDLEVSVLSRNAAIQVGDLPTIMAIPYQMQQLFQNLISNALKYSKEDIQPEIEIFSREPEGNRVEITIKDNGIGFEQEYAEKIFMVFQRLNSSDKYDGTGIGLALCRKIAENHKGTIMADSEKEVGSSFIIDLPMTYLQ